MLYTAAPKLLSFLCNIYCFDCDAGQVVHKTGIIIIYNITLHIYTHMNLYNIICQHLETSVCDHDGRKIFHFGSTMHHVGSSSVFLGKNWGITGPHGCITARLASNFWALMAGMVSSWLVLDHLWGSWAHADILLGASRGEYMTHMRMRSARLVWCQVA